MCFSKTFWGAWGPLPGACLIGAEGEYGGGDSRQ